MTVAGIDVAHQTLAVAIRTGEKTAKPEEFANTPSGHQALLTRLTRLTQAGVARVCLEATGSYHLDLALALDAGGLALMVVNPKAANRFAEALMTRTKSDAVDAAVLAEFAQRMPFEPWQRPDRAALERRADARRLNALTEARTQAKNQLHALQQSTTTPALILEEVQLAIDETNARIARLRTAALALIAAEATLQDAFDLLTSAKGIGAASAIQLLGELLVLPPDLRAKQWVAMAGLDPRHATSGTSVNKKPRLSKAGNRYLRGALHMPALSATRHDEHVKKLSINYFPICLAGWCRSDRDRVVVVSD
ncbi:IS110 family transposase [uncultured Thiocystis sp.]|jgi:transposase|uniref:IS110 family transposase n=1 Tax=uncultured Thiocystis sp. TaxID=1202134 RepID=UPI0025EC50AD|nr:IS110 family transposase [uncultured Thiocystis sp.]